MSEADWVWLRSALWIETFRAGLQWTTSRTAVPDPSRTGSRPGYTSGSGRKLTARFGGKSAKADAHRPTALGCFVASRRPDARYVRVKAGRATAANVVVLGASPSPLIR